MPLLKTLFGWNYTLTVSLTCWFAAQVLKTIISVCTHRSFSIERMWGAGGMPSSHTATVMGLVIACGRTVGVHSPSFGVAAVLAVIVMYDAMGVRRETGEQSKVLNRMIRQWMEENEAQAPILADRKLKELVGHTPLEVMSGALLGMVIALLIPIP